MTGSPQPKEPTDVWAQCRIVRPAGVPQYFGAFREMVMHRITQFKWLPRPNATQIVAEAMQPSVRFTRDDMTDLPACTEQDFRSPLSPEQEKLYNKLMADYAAEYQAKKITSANEGVRLSKLLQVAGGFVYDQDGAGHTIPAKPRFDLLDEVMEELDTTKVIVFTPFTYLTELVHAYLEKKHGRKVGLIHGKVPHRQRMDTLGAFQKGNLLRELVAHPGTMSHGLTLTAANTIIWFLPTYSLETYQQANARITRPGQTHKQHIVRLQSSKVEARIYNRLANRERTQGALLDLLKDHAKG